MRFSGHVRVTGAKQGPRVSFMGFPVVFQDVYEDSVALPGHFRWFWRVSGALQGLSGIQRVFSSIPGCFIWVSRGITGAFYGILVGGS